MGELLNAFQADMQALSAPWVSVWVNVMGGILLLSVPFSIFRTEARVVLAAFILGAAGVLLIYSQLGYVGLMGLGHIVIWGPAVIWLLSRRAHWRVKESWAGKWLVLAVAVMSISLVFDVVDVGRWLLQQA